MGDILKDKPKVGISQCLLGDNVRYNAGHKLDHYIKRTLGQFVEFIPICPEVESGMGIPREAVQLNEVDNKVKMLGMNTQKDFTDNMEKWIESKISSIKDIEFSGFILKSKSPSCGIYRTRLYRENKPPSLNHRGMFASRLMNDFPNLLVEEEGRLHDPVIRDNFIERIFINHRWFKLQKDLSVHSFVKFQESLKYTLMVHSPKLQKELGVIVANTNKNDLIKDSELYYDLLNKCLAQYSTTKSHRNVLEHIVGYFKKDLTKDEKVEIQDLISSYNKGLIPLIVPITILNHYTRKFSSDYLKGQFYLNPHPLELLLRNNI